MDGLIFNEYFDDQQHSLGKVFMRKRIFLFTGIYLFFFAEALSASSGDEELIKNIQKNLDRINMAQIDFSQYCIGGTESSSLSPALSISDNSSFEDKWKAMIQDLSDHYGITLTYSGIDYGQPKEKIKELVELYFKDRDHFLLFLNKIDAKAGKLLLFQQADKDSNTLDLDMLTKLANIHHLKLGEFYLGFNEEKNDFLREIMVSDPGQLSKLTSEQLKMLSSFKQRMNFKFYDIFKTENFTRSSSFFIF